MDTNKNFLLFVVLSILIVVGFNYLRPTPPPAPVVSTQAQPQPLAPTTANAPVRFRERSVILAEAPRVGIATPELAGSINLKGARFDDLQLTQYRETVDPASPRVTLLSPAGSAMPYPAVYAEFSWLADSKDIAVPTADTLWTTTDKQLTPEHPLKLTWKNPQGVQFERDIAVDNHYMFTVTDRVSNAGTATVTLYPFGLVARQGNPVVTTSNVLYEGPLGVLGGTLEEFKYKKLMEDGRQTLPSDGGWLGLTSKYWLLAMIPAGTEKLTADFTFDGSGAAVPSEGHFQTDFRGTAVTLQPHGGDTTHVTHFFAGAKRISLLDAYEKKYDIPHFDRAIDFGWFYFLTKPFLYMLSFLGKSLGSLGVAILVFTVMLKLITLPLSLKSNHSMARMKLLQPQIARIKERYADDKVKQNQETMELFKREKVSPMSGCVPMLIQIPIFFALYKVLYVGIEMRQAPFYGWIHDMASPDPTSVLGFLPFALPDSLHIGVWPILMGCSMFLQQRLSPQTMDKSQARMLMFMPVLFTYMLHNMPAGLVIYWTWSNLLSVAQQWFIMRRDVQGRSTKDLV